MKNPIATLACCVALVAALSPVFSSVLAAAAAAGATVEHGGHCSRPASRDHDIDVAAEARGRRAAAASPH
jgi:hypothetical protein